MFYKLWLACSPRSYSNNSSGRHVIWYELRMWHHRDGEHRKDAPLFMFIFVPNRVISPGFFLEPRTILNLTEAPLGPVFQSKLQAMTQYRNEMLHFVVHLMRKMKVADWLKRWNFWQNVLGTPSIQRFRNRPLEILKCISLGGFNDLEFYGP